MSQKIDGGITASAQLRPVATPAKATPAGSGEARPVEAADSVWVVETILRGGAVKRIVIPCAHITEIEDIVYKDDEPLGYGVTLGATRDDSGVTHYEYIKGA